MAQKKILVDTNSYLRMAENIHPLLFTIFGKDEYCLYVLPELNKELNNNKFQSKFPWVHEADFVGNRSKFPTVGRKAKNSIKQTEEYLWDYVLSDLPGPSPVDVKYIAYSLELNIPVVTDDQDMIELASVFDAVTMSTIDLLKLMVDCSHINLSKIQALCMYWNYNRDYPSNYHRDIKKHFPELLLSA
ncbi:DNA-binding protein [Providencia vermicola]|uniref:DNA-binding protein n=1 Tax=Providencia TaxID=586 RepID=UPI00234A9648|nr:MULTISPECIES: DNA-binding protein [Providencia]MDU7494703.1 DNA-binding protein [Providencia rettgeri]